MPKQTVPVINTLGLHLRASSKRVNAKSVLGVTMLAAGKGTEVEIETTGEQEAEALQALIDLFASRFGEES